MTPIQSQSNWEDVLFHPGLTVPQWSRHLQDHHEDMPNMRLRYVLEGLRLTPDPAFTKMFFKHLFDVAQHHQGLVSKASSSVLIVDLTYEPCSALFQIMTDVFFDREHPEQHMYTEFLDNVDMLHMFRQNIIHLLTHPQVNRLGLDRIPAPEVDSRVGWNFSEMIRKSSPETVNTLLHVMSLKDIFHAQVGLALREDLPPSSVHPPASLRSELIEFWDQALLLKSSEEQQDFLLWLKTYPPQTQEQVVHLSPLVRSMAERDWLLSKTSYQGLAHAPRKI